MSGVCSIDDNAVFSPFYPRAWPWRPPDTGLFDLPPTPQSKTLNIGSASANFSSSLALVLQQNKQPKKKW